MKQGKYAAPVRRRRRRNTLKPMLIAMAVVLLLGCVTGGTLAWLTSTTGPVTNTFTTSDIDITLEETGATDNKASFKMIPGWTITKDPKVTVVEGSEDCWLFVKVEKSANFDSFMEYDMAEGWTQLQDASNNDVPGVFYRQITSTGMGTPIPVLKNDQVTVKDTVKKADMNGLTQIVGDETVTKYPTLTFTAYASQLYKSAGVEFSAYDAWLNVYSATP